MSGRMSGHQPPPTTTTTTSSSTTHQHQQQNINVNLNFPGVANMNIPGVGINLNLGNNNNNNNPVPVLRATLIPVSKFGYVLYQQRISNILPRSLNVIKCSRNIINTTDRFSLGREFPLLEL